MIHNISRSQLKRLSQPGSDEQRSYCLTSTVESAFDWNNLENDGKIQVPIVKKRKVAVATIYGSDDRSEKSQYMEDKTQAVEKHVCDYQP